MKTGSNNSPSITTLQYKTNCFLINDLDAIEYFKNVAVRIVIVFVDIYLKRKFYIMSGNTPTIRPTCIFFDMND